MRWEVGGVFCGVRRVFWAKTGFACQRFKGHHSLFLFLVVVLLCAYLCLPLCIPLNFPFMFLMCPWLLRGIKESQPKQRGESNTQFSQ